MPASLISHTSAGYRFLPGIAPYSSGVIAEPGHEIVHVHLQSRLPWAVGLSAARNWLEAQGLPVQSLCGVELRCPKPHSLGGFSDFNEQYQQVLTDWNMHVGELNPVARTNVSPVVDPPAETVLHGYSFCRPGETAEQTYVVAGGGELPHRDLERQHIVSRGDTSPQGMLAKAECVLGIMNHRLNCLQANPQLLSGINVYTAYPMRDLLQGIVSEQIPAAARIGIRWYLTRPPVEEIDFEMDLRGVVQDLTVDLTEYS